MQCSTFLHQFAITLMYNVHTFVSLKHYSFPQKKSKQKKSTNQSCKFNICVDEYNTFVMFINTNKSYSYFI